MIRGFLSLLIALLFTACGGTLTEEQRKGLQAEKQTRQIKRVKQEDIYKKALEMGKSAIKMASKGDLVESQKQCTCQIIKMTEKGQDMDSPKMEELWEAYMSTNISDLPEANVQKEGDDFLIVSDPAVKDSSGVKMVEGVWFVRLTKKQVVLAL